MTMLFVNAAHHFFCQIRALTAEGSTNQGRAFCGARVTSVAKDIAELAEVMLNVFSLISSEKSLVLLKCEA